MNIEKITHINLRKFSVYSKLVIILTKRTCNIICMITRLILFAKDCYVMIRAIHSRTHEIGRTCINSYILFVYMFLMDRSCYKASIRSHHESSHLCKNSHIRKTCRNHDLVKLFMNTFSDDSNIVWSLIRSIRNTYSA